eukprot:CAMPEP_0201478034 /NCGR_PEP_ID=MMETSP0151_2-20130828/2957_1 /ASSEMBLY_ACC=CAM_ASM_000257 /TAXON_ID=200890 /ORGANISM="Paramoeba atlantica, Strain 621/1 / CCAP 1560/9" /LENGTH=659 /DNA_ID=CAMNT_0047858967 /DNA_START=812 /DNA_END=2791 /DNA_ORIENTATION=-
MAESHEQLPNKYIAVVDFGGQYAHLIANRIRRLGVYAELMPASEETVQHISSSSERIAGLILSGGGGSVVKKREEEKERETECFVKMVDVEVLLGLGVPILGLCLGHQYLSSALGGLVSEDPDMVEYGPTEMTILDAPSEEAPWVLRGKGRNGTPNATVWMSHGDSVTRLPNRFPFVAMAKTDRCPVAAMACPQKKIFGFQFHPEVTHSENGMKMLEGFTDLCDTSPWDMSNYLSKIETVIKNQVKERKVFILVSGGVDSSVAFALLAKSLGKERCYGLLVDHGFLRHREAELVVQSMNEIGFDNLHLEDASELFLSRLKGKFDPEEKRKIMGQSFLDVKSDVAKRLHLSDDEWLLGQGTIYPDTIETGGTKHASKIKTHHNRIEAFDEMIKSGRLVEPLRDLYKDEVRALGRLLNLPSKLVDRHPFPGPGLGVRILCCKEPYHPDNLDTISEQTAALITNPLLETTSFSVLPIRSVGVQGDNRTYASSVSLFPPKPAHEMSQDYWDALWNVAERVPNSVRDVNRVLICLSHCSDVVVKGEGGKKEQPFLVHSEAVELSPKRADRLRLADQIVHDLVCQMGLYDKIWQFPVVMVPIGVGEGNEGIVLRPVDSTEAMTASSFHLPFEFLSAANEKICKIDGIDTVFYDLTSKPPGTIEWE